MEGGVANHVWSVEESRLAWGNSVHMVERERALGGDLVARNRTFYETLWSDARLHQPTRFNTWPLVAFLFPMSPIRLELGPGLRPRLPIADTCFIDISTVAGRRLHALGGRALTAHIGALLFQNETFDLVCACDVIKHVDDDGAVFGEMSRVLKDDGVLLLAGAAPRAPVGRLRYMGWSCASVWPR